MNTVYKMAQDLAVLALDTNNAALKNIVDSFIDADDLIIAHGSPRNKKAAKAAYDKMRRAWRFHFS